MAKTIRPTYPVEVSIGILLLIFAVSFFLAPQIFEVPRHGEGENLYVGVFLVSCAVIIMLLVLWEEILFPIKVKPTEGGGVVFRNHRSKLKKQLLIYCIIPAIFTYLYLNYEVNHIRFFIWAGICIIAPVAGKLISGIRNYNDFLRLTREEIEYKNNAEIGTFKVNTLKQITLVKDERKVLHKIQLLTADNNQITIDLDEMELEAFYDSIDKFIIAYYKDLVKE